MTDNLTPPATSRRLFRTGALGLGALAVAGVSACSTLSPATVNKPYPPSDGVQATLTLPNSREEVKLRNFLVVGTTPEGPGEVIGSVVNGSSRAVTVTFTADGGGSGPIAPVRVSVPAGGVTNVGPDQDSSISLTAIPDGPGALVEMTAATTGSGSVPLDVPVVEAAGPYATLAPRPSSTATSTATATGTATPTEGATEGAEPTSTGSATEPGTEETPS